MGGRGSAGGNNPGGKASDITQAVTKDLNNFVANRDISERSRMYDEELDNILRELPDGARIYTGSTTALVGITVDGKRLTGDYPTFFEKTSGGLYPKIRRFGSNDYNDEYSDSLRRELARGKRLGKLNIRIEKR